MLTVDTKEQGQMKLSVENQLGTQREFITQVVSGLEANIHFFVILKGRQVGVTTLSSALDLYWHFSHNGMQGTFASHNEEARDSFRSMLTMYYEGLPKTHRIPLVQNNRYFLSFKNRSRIAMQIGGGAKKKQGGGKGRGQAFTFIHATECSSWEDEESLDSMLASLAQKNPQRLQVFESTARGFNLFHDMWKDAKRAVTQKAIFIGWWRNRLYRCEQDSNEYRVYWDGKLSASEREWVRAIKLMYGYEIEAEQMAWWRWMGAEIIHDENHLMQEHPPHEELAFILSGNNFFSVTRLEELRKSIAHEERPRYFAFRFGDDFMDTSAEETVETMGDLTVWEEPIDGAYYSIGGDPAFGSSDWADRFVISVWRCYADRLEQVAEFCVTDLSTYRYAWVLCYLAGAYKNSMVNLEVNGPGQAVLSEMKNLQRKIGSLPRNQARALTDVVGHMSWYLYQRLDSPGGGGRVYHYKTTRETKERMLNVYRDLWYRNMAYVHSTELVEEMKIIVREQEDGFLGASGRGKDDRVIAAALAAVQYTDYVQPKLAQMKVLYLAEERRRAQIAETGHGPTPEQDALGRNLKSFLQSIGMQHNT